MFCFENERRKTCLVRENVERERYLQKGRENACCRWVKNEGLWASISLWTNGIMISKCSFHMQRLNIDVKSGFSYNAAFVAAYRGSQFEMNVIAWPCLIMYNQWHACSLALWFAGIKEGRKCLNSSSDEMSSSHLHNAKNRYVKGSDCKPQFFRTTIQPSHCKVRLEYARSNWEVIILNLPIPNFICNSCWIKRRHSSVKKKSLSTDSIYNSIYHLRWVTTASLNSSIEKVYITDT